MLKSAALILVRSAIGHESDTQVTDTQVNSWLDVIYPAFRREILDIAPGLYTAVAATQVLTPSVPDFTLPADFERVNRFEVQSGTLYMPVPVATSVGADFDSLSFREEAGVLRLAPAQSCSGTYKLTYNKAPTLTGDYLIEVPSGCEQVVVERVAALARVKFNEDPTPHQMAADRIWHGVPGIPGSGQKTAIRRRYGGHSRGGMTLVGGW